MTAVPGAPPVGALVPVPAVPAQAVPAPVVPAPAGPLDAIDALTGIGPREFAFLAGFLHERTGVRLGPGKESLVSARLDRRVRHLGLQGFEEYVALLAGGDAVEAQAVVDLLTTNETSFFREPAHFELLADVVAPEHRAGRPLRVWSAAASTGEEAYTAAMVLADVVPAVPFEVVGTDVSSRVVEVAERGVYPLDAAERIPPALLRRWCRRGQDEYEGLFAVSAELRSRTRFLNANLLDDLSGLGPFDVVLLRNVMIYFDAPTKAALVERVTRMLHPGGYLIVGHTESLQGIRTGLDLVRPSVYRAPRRPADGAAR